MKIHDSLFGGMLILIAVAMWFMSDSLPNPTMQPYGPGFFPKILAVFLFATSAILVVKSLSSSQRLVSLDEWAKHPGSLVRVLLVPVGVALFVAFNRELGFIPGATLLLWLMFVADEVRPLPAFFTALIIVFVVHSIFYLGLNVQLPWGLLQPVRW